MSFVSFLSFVPAFLSIPSRETVIAAFHTFLLPRHVSCEVMCERKCELLLNSNRSSCWRRWRLVFVLAALAATALVALLLYSCLQNPPQVRRGPVFSDFHEALSLIALLLSASKRFLNLICGSQESVPSPSPETTTKRTDLYRRETKPEMVC